TGRQSARDRVLPGPEGCGSAGQCEQRRAQRGGRSMSPAAPVLPHVQPTVVQMLAAAAAAAPKTEALVFGERRLDYAGYLACVAAFACELQSMGAKGG